MAVNLGLRRPVPAPAPQLRIIWQGLRSGDVVEAGWVDASGRPNRWSGSRGLAWLQRDALRANEEWKINLAGVPGDIQSITLSMSSALAGTVGVVVQPLAGDPNSAVVHPGAELSPGATVELLELRRVGGAWQLTALSTTVGAGETRADGAEPNRVPRPTAPPPAGGPFPGRPGPVGDGPAPAGPAPATPSLAPRAPVHAWTDQLDDGPRVSIPDRLAPAVDAARSTGAVRRARVTAVIDLSASMYPWIASGAVAAVLTAVQALAGAAQRPSVSTRFLPDGGSLEMPLDDEPAGTLLTHLNEVGLRTGDRSLLLSALAGDGSADAVRLVVTDDPSLAERAGGAGATVVIVGGAGTAGPTTSGAVFVAPGPVDVNRLARDLADACFTTARR